MSEEIRGPGSDVSGFQSIETIVLFVCTGNICRSPVAELILQSLAIPGVRAESAGTEAVVDARIDTSMRDYLDSEGIDSSDFRARQLTPTLVARSDITVTASREHRTAVLREVPSALRRTFTLMELAALTELAESEGKLEPLTRSSRIDSLSRLRGTRQPDVSDDVIDPYLLSEAHYRRAYETVSGAVRGPLARLLGSFVGE